MGRHLTYTEEFKLQIARLRESGKSYGELSREYGITKSSASNWYNQYKGSGSFKAADNVNAEAKELKRLQKEIKQLQMENDILKQAALILGRKGE